MTKYKVGVIIVSYNSSGELKECIKSVFDQANSSINPIPILVDNNSTDDSVKIAKKLNVKCIANGKNLGFSKANNIGVREAYDLGCDYIMLLNPDAIMKANTLASMLAALTESNKKTAAIGPLMVNRDGSSANEGYYLKAPSFMTILFFSTALRPWALKRKFLVRRYEERNLVSMRSVEQIPGACLLTSKANLDDIGLLDEDFAIWFEDVEWSYRARKKGYTLLFCPDAHVIHEGGVSFSKWEGLEKAVTFYVSMKTFFKKHKPVSYYFVVLALSANSLLLYVKSRDRSNLEFLKRFLKQKKGVLPN